MTDQTASLSTPPLAAAAPEAGTRFIVPKTSHGTHIFAEDSRGNAFGAHRRGSDNPELFLHCADTNLTHSADASRINAHFAHYANSATEQAPHNVAEALASAMHYIANAKGTRLKPSPAAIPEYTPHRLCQRAKETGGILTRSYFRR